MTETLKVKRLDSPLNRNTSQNQQPTELPPPPATPAAAQPRRRPQAARQPRLASVADQPTDGHAPATLPDPPTFDESLELISSRLPSSLRRSLSELTAALRDRSGERRSQKSLPEQEVLAVLIWAAGSADDPDAVARLAANLNAYRARRYAAAAQALASE